MVKKILIGVLVALILFFFGVLVVESGPTHHRIPVHFDAIRT